MPNQQTDPFNQAGRLTNCFFLTREIPILVKKKKKCFCVQEEFNELKLNALHYYVFTGIFQLINFAKLILATTQMIII